MTGKADNDEVIEQANMEKPPKNANVGKPFPKKANPVHKKEATALKPSCNSHPNLGQNTFEDEQNTVEGTVALTSNFSGDFQELDKISQLMMGKTANKKYGMPLYKCKECGKEAISGAMKKHIEANHLEGISLPCNFCKKTFRCKNSLAMHNHRKHKDHKDML